MLLEGPYTVVSGDLKSGKAISVADPIDEDDVQNRQEIPEARVERLACRLEGLGCSDGKQSSVCLSSFSVSSQSLCLACTKERLRV